MTRPDMDPNDISRYVGGRMSPTERESAVAHFSESERDLDVLADSAYVLNDLGDQDGVVADPAEDAEDAEEAPGARPPMASDRPADEEDAGPAADPKVIPLGPPSTRRAWRRAPARWLALAAVLVGVLLVFPPSRWGRDPAGPGEFVALLANREDGLPDEWTNTPAWDVTRSGTGDPLDDGARAARIGALWVDLELAVAGRQVEQTQHLCRQIDFLLGGVSAIGPAVSQCAEIGRNAGAPASQQAERLREGRQGVSELLQQDVHFTLGAWAEAARLAAAGQNAAFFRSRATRRALDQLAQSPEVEQPARQAGERVRRAVGGDGAPDWSVVTPAVDELVGLLAS